MKKILLIIILITNLCYSSIEELGSDLRNSVERCKEKTHEVFRVSSSLCNVLDQWRKKYPELTILLRKMYDNCNKIETRIEDIDNEAQQYLSTKKILSIRDISSLIDKCNRNLKETQQSIELAHCQITHKVNFEIKADLIHQQYATAKSKYLIQKNQLDQLFEHYLRIVNQISQLYMRLTKNIEIDQNLKDKITKIQKLITVIQNNHKKISSSSEHDAIKKINLHNQFYLNNILSEYPKLVEYYQKKESETSGLIDIITRTLKEIEQANQLTHGGIQELAIEFEAKLAMCYRKKSEYSYNIDLLKKEFDKLKLEYPELTELLEINFNNCIFNEELLDGINYQFEEHCSCDQRLSRPEILNLIRLTNQQSEKIEELIQRIQLQITFISIFKMEANPIQQEYLDVKSKTSVKKNELDQLLQNYLHTQDQALELYAELQTKINIDLKDKIAQIEETVILVKNNYQTISDLSKKDAINKINLHDQFYLNTTLDAYPQLVEYYKEIEKEISGLIETIKQSLEHIEQIPELLTPDERVIYYTIKLQQID